MSLADKLASKLKYNKSIESVSRRRTQLVRDSQLLSTGTFTGLILVLSLFLVNNTYATSSSITITIDDNIVDLNVAPTAAGAFSKSSASKIGVSTTNYTGYTLSISANGNNDNDSTALINGDKSLSSIETAVTEAEFKALDATSYNNRWGYLPSKYNSETNTSFLPSPSTNGDILDITSTANAVDSSTGNPIVNEYEITLGARVDTTASLGSYSNVFLVEAIANATPYTITFVDNTVTDMPVDMSGTSDTDTIAIVNTVPIRNGYTFLGWCRGTVTNNANGNDTCSGTVYNPNGNGTNLNVTIDQTSSSNNITLYAVWGGNYTIGALVTSGATMQDLGTMSVSKQAKIIDSMVEETNYTLKDSRDNQSYTISKLKDGQVWMTTNLNLAGGTEINSGNSDVNANYTLPKSSTEGFSSDTTAYVYNSSNTTNCGASGQNTPCYSYYSYLAATAGSGASVSSEAQDAPWSICPKGWRLPTSGVHSDNSAASITGYKRGDFYRLVTAYGVNLESTHNSSTTTFNDNLGPGTSANFLLAGYYGGSAFYGGGTGGYYWSSTSTSSTHARDLYFNTGFVSSASSLSRRCGFSVRCILK